MSILVSYTWVCILSLALLAILYIPALMLEDLKKNSEKWKAESGEWPGDEVTTTTLGVTLVTVLYVCRVDL